jgi:hypothetical protein
LDEASEAEIGAVVAAFYGAFDNRGGRPAATEALRALFMDDARIVRVADERVESWGVEAFIAPRAAMLADGTLVEFHEWETQAQTTVLGGIASRRSLYRKAGRLNGADYAGEGRKLIQFVRDGGRWRIASVLWEDA